MDFDLAGYYLTVLAAVLFVTGGIIWLASRISGALAAAIAAGTAIALYEAYDINLLET